MIQSTTNEPPLMFLPGGGLSTPAPNFLGGMDIKGGYHEESHICFIGSF
jgi:hypothetical protein